MSGTRIDLHEVYHRYVDAMNDREFDRMHEFAHDQLTVNGQPLSREDYVAGLRGYVAAVEDFVWRLDDLIIEGDRVAARVTDTGTPVAEWLGHQPTGEAVEFTEYAFYHFRDGRFENIWYLLDAQAIQSQLGA